MFHSILIFFRLTHNRINVAPEIPHITPSKMQPVIVDLEKNDGSSVNKSFNSSVSTLVPGLNSYAASSSSSGPKTELNSHEQDKIKLDLPPKHGNKLSRYFLCAP